ncbi:unnamed protein product [Ranitomeya imitator]|uniref:Ig-like domain-containing protein n=1 Tax=Ranitomeya imitator TaxID=111125 RepID=A0ABN9MGQ3_9NEOB|nr:unnamed protein product [Ranitomeya imitator]
MLKPSVKILVKNKFSERNEVISENRLQRHTASPYIVVLYLDHECRMCEAGPRLDESKAETRGPSVFPLVPCCDSLSSDQVSIGCLSTGYLPTPVDVQWNSGSITGGIRNYPAVLGKQGTYLSTSLLTIPTSEWTSDKKFVCNVNHKPSGVKINKEIEACSSKTSPPTVEVMQASCGESGSVDLVCLILGYTPSNIKVEWLLNGEPTSIIPSNSTPYKESDGTFGSRSKVSVPKQDWIAGDRYTCKVSHPASETKNEDTIHKCPVPENLVPKVVVLPPTPKDILISKQPKVVCQVSQVESPESLKISWKREDGKKILAFSSEPEIDAFGRYTVKSTLKISLSDWSSGQSCTCIVQNNELPSPIEKSIKKTEAPATDPSVYVFPPQADELKIHDFVSVPCLIKGFKPKEIYVQWKKNGYVQDEDHYTNSEPMQQDDEETYFIYSTLTIEKSDWNRGAALTCSAVHSKITEKTIKKSNGK